jgi:hypothetical protein
MNPFVGGLQLIAMCIGVSIAVGVYLAVYPAIWLAVFIKERLSHRKPMP